MQIQKVISSLMEKGVIIEKDALEFIKTNTIDYDKLLNFKGFIITKDSMRELAPPKPKIEIVKTKSKLAKDYPSSIVFTKEFKEELKEKNINSFLSYFNSRYDKLKNILINRPELRNTISLGRFKDSTSERDLSVIGMVSNILKTKNNNTIIELEDPTGKINVMVMQSKEIGQEKVVTDEIIGIKGNKSRNYLFADSIIWPDIPIPIKVNAIKDPLQAAFISDLHYGSKDFIKDVEKKFLDWIKSKQAERVKYLFIAGDIVDGVGIYPGQEKNLLVNDIYSQYKLFENFIEKIPEHIEITVIPGQHDAVRQAEPQPALGKDLLPTISSFKNVHLMTNPAYLNIHSIDCPGINILTYHGASFTTLINTLPILRQKGTTQPQHVMIELLKRRHLAPLYGSTMISPEEEDYLVIDKVPDIFHVGELHAHCAENYKGTSLICSSTFQGQTDFMDRIGHVANPGKITIVDLQTRRIEIKDLMG